MCRWKSLSPRLARSVKQKTAWPTSEFIPSFRTLTLRSATAGTASPSASSPPRSSGTVSSDGRIVMPPSFASVGDELASFPATKRRLEKSRWACVRPEIWQRPQSSMSAWAESLLKKGFSKSTGNKEKSLSNGDNTLFRRVLGHANFYLCPLKLFSSSLFWSCCWAVEASSTPDAGRPVGIPGGSSHGPSLMKLDRGEGARPTDPSY